MPAAAHLFASSEIQKRTQVETLSRLMQAIGADKPVLQLRETAFGRGWKQRDQSFTDKESENGIAEELELLVVGMLVWRPSLGGEGAVGKSADQQVPVLKNVTESGLQFLKVRGHEAIS
jgi:hypothetical protein